MKLKFLFALMIALFVIIVASTFVSAQSVDTLSFESIHDYDESIILRTETQEIEVRVVINSLPKMVIARWTIFVVPKLLPKKEEVTVINCMRFKDGEVHSEKSNDMNFDFNQILNIVKKKNNDK